jgi:CheY-like chemotaxis protein
MRKLRVLAVDDNQFNLRICREIFEHLGCDVDVVGSGEAALELVSVNHYDMICLDRFMPGLPGDEVAARLPTELFVVAWSTETANLPPRYNQVLPKPVSIAAAAGVLARAISTAPLKLRFDTL